MLPQYLHLLPNDNSLKSLHAKSLIYICCHVRSFDKLIWKRHASADLDRKCPCRFNYKSLSYLSTLNGKVSVFTSLYVLPFCHLTPSPSPTLRLPLLQPYALPFSHLTPYPSSTLRLPLLPPYAFPFSHLTPSPPPTLRPTLVSLYALPFSHLTPYPIVSPYQSGALAILTSKQASLWYLSLQTCNSDSPQIPLSLPSHNGLRYIIIIYRYGPTATNESFVFHWSGIVRWAASNRRVLTQLEWYWWSLESGEREGFGERWRLYGECAEAIFSWC